MIEIGDAHRHSAPELDQPMGGFAWWYADLVNPAGDGATLIWSYGLPFLPGYADAARRGRPQRPRGRPSINLAVYRRGRPDAYLLQEYPEHDGCGGEPEDEQQIGRSRFTRAVSGGRLRLDVRLDCALPGTGERLTGEFHMEGAARQSDGAAHPGGVPHLWTPLSGPAVGELRVMLGSREVAEVRGRAYHDRNTGHAPLHALGIGHWTWARLPFDGRERIAYLLWPADGSAPRAIGLEIGPDGATEHVEGLRITLQGRRWTPIGPRLPARIELTRDNRRWLVLCTRRPVDLGPFYLRFLCEAEAETGERTLGWGETVRPDRVDLALHRPFVRMRVHRLAGGNSRWVPLFTGPRSGRVARLLRHWAGRG